MATFFCRRACSRMSTRTTSGNTWWAPTSTPGSFSHSIRYAYLKFQNEISDAAIGSGLPLSDFPRRWSGGQYLSIDVGSGDRAEPSGSAEHPSANNQIKYDGSKTWGRHILRYGASYNHIQGGGFAALLRPGATDLRALRAAMLPSRISAPTEFPGGAQSAELPCGPGSHGKRSGFLDY